MTSDAAPDPDVDSVLSRLRTLGSPENVAGMRRYGIGGQRAFGVRASDIRAVARSLGRRDRLAEALWQTGWREARLVAAMIADPYRFPLDRMEAWVRDLDSWDVCDGVCNELFRRTPAAWARAVAWSRESPTFVRRAGFVLMAQLAVHDRQASDDRFLALLPDIERGACDERDMVVKGTSWALRQIGKRNRRLHAAAVDCGLRLQTAGCRRSRRVASDALRELRSEPVLRRLDGRRPA